MSGNHQGSYLSAKRFVEKVIEFEADIIKFQVYKPDTITFKSTSKDFRVDNGSSWKEYNFLYDLYKKAHTPWDWIENLATYLDKKKFPWFASPFDQTAVNFLEEIGCSAYKVASPEITDIGLIEALSKTGKPIMHSTKSVTVIHDNSMKADGWATALLALGRVDGLKIAEKEKIAVLFIDEIDDKFLKFKSNQFLNFKQN